jgi:anti-anti-sigma factor
MERVAMLEVLPGWPIEVDRGPNWLFIRLHAAGGAGEDADGLAESLWDLLQRQFARRLVLELDELSCLRSAFIGELVRLRKRIYSSGGMMRICGLSDSNQEVLRICRLDDCFPHYRNREDAVMGHCPAQPR